MRYIGGKSLLIDAINEVIDANIDKLDSAIDVFAGSGIVSQNFKNKGYKTISNDFLYFSYVLNFGNIVLNKKPYYKKLKIKDPIKYLNELKLEDTDFLLEDLFIYNTPYGEPLLITHFPFHHHKIYNKH